MAEKDFGSFSGKVMRITYQNQENGYAVAKLQPQGDGEVINVVGKMPGLVEGQEIEVSGSQIVHPKYGPQVEVAQYQIKPPRGTDGVRRYLASGLIKGVGKKLAGRLVEHLGEDALQTIMQKPDELAKVPGIGKKRAITIREAVVAHGELRNFMVFLQSHGIPASTALRIHRRFGAGALGIVRNQPHRLASEMHGIGFATADKIAAKLGISHQDPGRLEAGLSYTLGRSRDEGHLFLPYEELVEKSAAILGVERSLLGPAFAALHKRGEVARVECEGQQRIYLGAMNRLENLTGSNIARLSRRKGILPQNRAIKASAWVEKKLGMSLAPAQRQALTTMLTQGLAVLTGGPGTGKTTLLRALIVVALRMEVNVALAAPTGRAARRLADSTGQSASTLHRLLEYQPKENRFARTASRPLEAELIVVDECSMVDIWLAAYLTEAVAPNSCLILVGDADQLPSVGAGLVLRQIIDSRVAPVARLNQIFRQDNTGLIVKNAHRVLAGEMPLSPPAGEEGDFYFVSEPDPNRAADMVRRTVLERLPRRFGFDPHNDIQVMAPMYRGALGCERLNQLLRAELNPQAAGSHGLAPGDKIMQIKNNYNLEVFNGDLGRVEAIGESGCRVEMGERVLNYSSPDMDDLTLAYAVTVHKSQGSEYPAVVLALGMEHFIMLTRPLLYTAITRGQRLVVVIGHPGAMGRAVAQVAPTQRYAALDQRIRDANKSVE